jgi:hypothetical protein
MVTFTYDPNRDANDDKPWSEMAIEDLTHELRHGGTVESAAELLCRKATVEEVRKKAVELGLVRPGAVH